MCFILSNTPSWWKERGEGGSGPFLEDVHEAFRQWHSKPGNPGRATLASVPRHPCSRPACPSALWGSGNFLLMWPRSLWAGSVENKLWLWWFWEQSWEWRRAKEKKESSGAKKEFWNKYDIKKATLRHRNGDLESPALLSWGPPSPCSPSYLVSPVFVLTARRNIAVAWIFLLMGQRCLDYNLNLRQ